MASYQYLKDIKPEDLKPEEEKPLTKKEKRKNWWDYNTKWVVLAAVIIAAIVFITISSLRSGPKPDYQVALVSPHTISEETIDELETQLATLGTDQNGDGTVTVQINCYTVDYTDSENALSSAAPTSSVMAADDMTDAYKTEADAYAQMAGVVQLAADLESNISGIYFLYDPSGFENQTGILRCLDGTLPDTDADGNVQGYTLDDMVYAVKDCGFLSKNCPSACAEIGDYAIGFRGAWTDEAKEAIAKDDALWQALTAGDTVTQTIID